MFSEDQGNEGVECMTQVINQGWPNLAGAFFFLVVSRFEGCTSLFSDLYSWGAVAIRLLFDFTNLII